MNNDLTKGSITGGLIRFAIPLFLGQLLQQFYNMADAWVVGNFASNDAFAAVSSGGHLTFLIIGLFNGIAVGGGVVISRYFGAKNREGVQKAIHANFLFGIWSSVIATAAGLIFIPSVLRMMNTPDSVMPHSLVYFRIYFAGVFTVILYNVCMSVMRALGDSLHPLYYLIVSSLVNVALDLLFVAGFQWGVGGAAFATVIAQGLSVVLCLIRMSREKDESLRLDIKKLKLNKDMMAQVIRQGLPTGIQNSVVSVGNRVIQTNINAFGKMAMAGCGSYAKIEGFAFLPVTCFTMALTTFVSQNLGAKQYDRAKKGARFGILCSITIAELIGFVIYAAAPTLIAAFNSDPAVVHYGVMQARTIALFYFLLAFSHCIAAVLRGSGHAAVPMVVMLCVWCLFRVSYITVTVRLIPDIRVIFWAYPLTWSISSVIFLYLFLKGKWVYGFEKGGKQR